jgi:DNA mismatch endonuclease, patch repair protein
MDTVDRETRSKIMASVGQKDTGAELLLRRALHKAGLRYRLHDRSLPGSPDLVFSRFRAAIFVHGCYWHSHGCYRSTVPKSRRDFWSAKFLANQSRDERNARVLREGGWRVLTVWECALRGKTSRSTAAIAKRVEEWLESWESVGEIAGTAIPTFVRADCETRWS